MRKKKDTLPRVGAFHNLATPFSVDNRESACRSQSGVVHTHKEIPTFCAFSINFVLTRYFQKSIKLKFFQTCEPQLSTGEDFLVPDIINETHQHAESMCNR